MPHSTHRADRRASVRRRAPSENQAADSASIRPFGPTSTEGRAAGMGDRSPARDLWVRSDGRARVGRPMDSPGGRDPFPDPDGHRRSRLSPLRLGDAVRFPLADWIDAHPHLRHDLAQSGMAGAIRRPAPSPELLRTADPAQLRTELADLLGVAPDRLFLTHGATESNAWVTLYVARAIGHRAGSFRIAYPEYPPLFDGPRAAGFAIVPGEGPCDLAVVSQPRNPEGDEWGPERLFAWADGARHLLVDETFREFGDRPSFSTADRPRLWTTGSFTKFYAGDDLRVGFVVAPEEERTHFDRFVGLFADGLPTASVAGALAALRHRTRLRTEIGAILGANRRALLRAFPGTAPPVGPVWFDRTGARSTDLAHRLLEASVLVCPGSYFGEPGGTRICLTRRTFPVDLAAYLAVRGAPTGGGFTPGRTTVRPVRPPRGATGRGRAGRA